MGGGAAALCSGYMLKFLGSLYDVHILPPPPPPPRTAHRPNSLIPFFFLFSLFSIHNLLNSISLSRHLLFPNSNVSSSKSDLPTKSPFLLLKPSDSAMKLKSMMGQRTKNREEQEREKESVLTTGRGSLVMQRCILILQDSHCPSLPPLPLPSTKRRKGEK